MTAVDVDALGKLREAIRDDLAGWPIGDGYYSTTVGTGEALELTDFLLAGSLAPLLAEVRRGRALRDELELLADTWSRSSEYRRVSDLGNRLLAALAATDGTP